MCAFVKARIKKRCEVIYHSFSLFAANKSGEIAVVNMQDGRGYFVPETDEELEEYINIEISRSREIEAKIRGLKRLRTSRENHAAWQRLVRSLNACEETLEEGTL